MVNSFLWNSMKIIMTHQLLNSTLSTWQYNLHPRNGFHLPWNLNFNDIFFKRRLLLKFFFYIFHFNLCIGLFLGCVWINLKNIYRPENYGLSYGNLWTLTITVKFFKHETLKVSKFKFSLNIKRLFEEWSKRGGQKNSGNFYK